MRLHILMMIDRRIGKYLWKRKVGSIRFGDFGGIKPIGGNFGFDRGSAIDRYYIEKFLALNSHRIRGRVLEIADNEYTTRFGGAATTKSDILHVDATNPHATIVGDLSKPGVLPDNTFDCIILTQTLHLIFDMRAAIKNLYAALAPGGTLLLTVPGVSSVDAGEWKSSWFWSLTEPALRRLLEEQFDPGSVDCVAYGNVFAAIAFLSGLCFEDVQTSKLDSVDARFPVTIATQATKKLANDC